MFVRWNRKLLAQSNPLKPMRYSISAVVVEASRNNGMLKQTVIKYLASIQEDHLEDQNHRLRFWEQVERQLEEFSLATRTHLIESIEKKIKRV